MQRDHSDMIKKLMGMDSLKPWRKAANRFQRRAAVVGLIKPMKKAGDFKPYFDFIDPMMMDEERVVHQGWDGSSRSLEKTA